MKSIAQIVEASSWPVSQMAKTRPGNPIGGHDVIDIAETRIAKGSFDFGVASTLRMLSPVMLFSRGITRNGTIPQYAGGTVVSEIQAKSIFLIVHDRLGDGRKLTAPRRSKELYRLEIGVSVAPAP
jgi:hypothetical protein